MRKFREWQKSKTQGNTNVGFPSRQALGRALNRTIIALPYAGKRRTTLTKILAEKEI